MKKEEVREEKTEKDEEIKEKKGTERGERRNKGKS